MLRWAMLMISTPFWRSSMSEGLKAALIAKSRVNQTLTASKFPSKSCKRVLHRIKLVTLTIIHRPLRMLQMQVQVSKMITESGSMKNSAFRSQDRRCHRPSCLRASPKVLESKMTSSSQLWSKLSIQVSRSQNDLPSHFTTTLKFLNFCKTIAVPPWLRNSLHATTSQWCRSTQSTTTWWTFWIM